MSIAVTFLEQNRQSPGDIAALLADFLSAARTSLHLAIYDFRLGPALAGPVIQALRHRAGAGVDVRIAYDAGKPSAGLPPVAADPATPGTADFVGSIGAPVQVKPITGGDPRLPKLMHHKYVIRDGQTSVGAVWTGSTNFTDDSWTLQENNIIRIDSPELCRYYETDFAELWSRGDITTTGRHDTGTAQVDGRTVEVAFSPGEGRFIDHEIAARIARARQRLKICSMLLTSGAILGALGDLLKHRRVPEYGGIYDGTQMDSVCAQWQGTPSAWKIAAFRQVAAGLAGKRSTPYAPGTPHDFMHNKVLVCDDLVITGSYNLSHSATENAENVLFLHDPALADSYDDYIDGLVKKLVSHEEQETPVR